MTEKRKPGENDVNEEYIVELRAELGKHLLDEEFHDGEYREVLRDDCSTCIHLAKQIDLIEKGKIVKYKVSKE